MKENNNLSRVTGLRGYQGEFTFSGLEEHLFSELRRFRTGKDEAHERDLVKVYIYILHHQSCNVRCKLHMLKIFLNLLWFWKVPSVLWSSFQAPSRGIPGSTRRLNKNHSSSERRWQFFLFYPAGKKIFWSITPKYQEFNFLLHILAWAGGAPCLGLRTQGDIGDINMRTGQEYS